MKSRRVSLFDRLPQIYKDRDEEQRPKHQLKHYLEIYEAVFSEIHKNIESLYHDLFIETCSDWAIPYVGDLLGVSYLKGTPWSTRADVADTITLRRRKGTLGAIELLTFDLTGWGIHCLELRDRMLLNQNINFYNDFQLLNELYGTTGISYGSPVLNGTVSIRDPSPLALLRTAFDPYYYTADLKPLQLNNIRYNIPNLAIFLWRLEAYHIQLSRPVLQDLYPREQEDPLNLADAATHLVGFHVDPLGRPMTLFNMSSDSTCRECGEENDEMAEYCSRCDEVLPENSTTSRTSFRLTQIDETPGPVLTARLTEESTAGHPLKYVKIVGFRTEDELKNKARQSLPGVGLKLYLWGPEFEDKFWPSRDGASHWTIRGSDLADWEESLVTPLKTWEVAIDPRLGRILIGLDEDEAGLLDSRLFLAFTYGAMKEVGAHPISREIPHAWQELYSSRIKVHEGGDKLKNALGALPPDSTWKLIEIQDSEIYTLDGEIDLLGPLYIRAASGQRPIIKVEQSLGFKPGRLKSDTETDDDFRRYTETLNVRLEGLFITGGDESCNPLITRAALNSLEIVQCVLDPSPYPTDCVGLAGIRPSMVLEESYGFDDSTQRDDFKEIPDISLENSVSGPLHIDRFHTLNVKNSVLDAGKGVGDNSEDVFAVCGSDSSGWGPPTKVSGVTVFGQVRVEQVSGEGVIFVHSLSVMKTLEGCLRYSYIVGNRTEIPQVEGCLLIRDSDPENPILRFNSETFGEYSYAQLSHITDYRIREGGPEDNTMGVSGFLREADKWRNIRIRFREFMPVGINPVFITVT